MIGVFSEAEEYSSELDIAVRAVQLACSLCQKMQDTLSKSRSKDQVPTMDDNFPVTVAGECSSNCTLLNLFFKYKSL